MGDTKAFVAGSLLDLLFEEPHSCRCLIAQDGRVLRANREWLRATGLALDRVLGANIIDLVPEARDTALEMHARARAGQHVEVPRHARRVRGRETWWEGTIDPVSVDGGTGLLITSREVSCDPAAEDVTERKRAEGMLRGTLQRFHGALSSMSDGVLIMTSEDRVEFANPALCELLRLKESPDRLVGLDSSEVFGEIADVYLHHDEEVARVEEIVRRGQPVKGEDVAMRDGRRVLREFVPLTVDGESWGRLWRFFDITERRRSEEALRESEDRFRLIVQGVKDCAIYMLASDGTVTSWSTAAEQMFGYREEEIVGRHRGVFFTDEQLRAGRPEHDLAEALADGHFEAEAWRVRKDGSRFWANVNLTALRDDAGDLRGFANVTRDFTERKRSVEALRESEARYRSLFEHMNEGIAYCRMQYDRDRPVDFLFVDVNPAFEALTGLKGVVGKRVSEVIPGIQESDAGLLERYGRVARLGTPETFETYVKSNGQWFDISVYSPAPGYFVAVFDVITERRRAQEELRESERKLRQAKDAAKMGAFNWDLLSDEMSWSDRCKALFGLGPDTVMTRPVFMARIHPEDRDRIHRALNDALTRKEPYDVEMRVPRPDGTLGWVASKGEVAYAADGRAVRMDGMMMDITARKHAEELVRDANEKLREADRQKNRFLAVLSHELRNPLAPIRNSLYILDHAAPGGEQARRAQATIHRQVGHMTWLIDDLLDVTRIAHGKVQLRRERLDLNALALRTVEDHRAVFARNEVRLEVLPAPAGVWVDGDRVRLAQIISNLLQNSAKFTPHGGKTTVVVESNPVRGEALLTVRDTGSGIPPEMLPRLFQAFAQADATLDRSKGGLGLGLALVKGLVELHGGSVSAASDGAGKGAAFAITLPLDVTAARIVPARPGLGVAATPRRVLVIEDNEDAADSLREVLEIDEHVVEVAYTGREGIEKAQVFRPDVVLCDIGLPEMDGYEVARRMRADPEVGRVGLIALSGYAQPEDVEMAREAGFDVHLAKPPDIDTLERALAEVGDARQDQQAP